MGRPSKLSPVSGVFGVSKRSRGRFHRIEPRGDPPRSDRIVGNQARAYPGNDAEGTKEIIKERSRCGVRSGAVAKYL